MTKYIVCKTCRTMQEAEREQMKLYDKYDKVKLVDFPMFSEGGLYKWECYK